MLAPKITDLKQTVLQMAAIAEQMVRLSFIGLEKGSICRYNDVMQLEAQVNQMELDIENDCISLIALYHPEARDLRQILMIYKINNDLERLADQAVNIAESTCEITGKDVNFTLEELLSMKEMTLTMLNGSINAFTKSNTEEARYVCRQDEILDSYNRRLTAAITKLLQDDPVNAPTYLHFLRIVKNLERIGDLSTNISEDTVYLVQGRVIKHNMGDEEQQ